MSYTDMINAAHSTMLKTWFR